LLRRAATEREAVSIVATGRQLIDLLLPADEDSQTALWADRSELWAVIDGKPFQIKDSASDQPLVLFTEGLGNLALAPDGESLVTALAVAEIPSAWEHLYPPPFAADPYNVLHAGKQDLKTFKGLRLVSRYTHVDLRSRTVRWLSDAPTGAAAGWWAGGSAVWSEDGTAVALPDAFVVSDTHGSVRPVWRS